MNQEEKIVDRAHRLLIERILDGTYPIGSELPGERSLSKDLGIARNALREAMQRLGYDGWLEISQGKATRVRDYLRDGNLNILIDLLNADDGQPRNFVPDLMELWALMAKDYTLKAVHREPNRILERLDLYHALEDTPQASAQAMWQLHRALIDYCGNVVYGLVFNSFADFYRRLAREYYQDVEQRERARTLWSNLERAIRAGEPPQAALVVYDYLIENVSIWRGLALKHTHTKTNEPE